MKGLISCSGGLAARGKSVCTVPDSREKAYARRPRGNSMNDRVNEVNWVLILFRGFMVIVFSVVVGLSLEIWCAWTGARGVPVSAPRGSSSRARCLPCTQRAGMWGSSRAGCRGLAAREGLARREGKGRAQASGRHTWWVGVPAFGDRRTGVHSALRLLRRRRSA